MQWVHRKNILFLFAVLLPALCGSSLFVANSADGKVVRVVSVEKPRPRITCFRFQDLIRLSTSDRICPTGYIYLGEGPLIESATSESSTNQIHPLLNLRFHTAASFARTEGISLYITSGFRTLNRQAQLFQREVEIRGSETEAAKWVLPPQYSNHPRGLAIDVNYPDDKPGALWLEKNGAKFGLCRVYENEWWHFEGTIAPGGICPPLAPNALIALGAPQNSIS